jgi:hypothetical protein
MAAMRDALRVVVGHCWFWGCCGVFVFWASDAAPGRDIYFVLHGFVGVELLVDGGESTEEQAGDVGESGGASGGDVTAGEEPKEMGEGMVDALGGLEVFGAHGEQVGEVLSVGGWRFGVAGQNLDCGSRMRQAHWRPVGVWYWQRSAARAAWA